MMTGNFWPILLDHASRKCKVHTNKKTNNTSKIGSRLNFELFILTQFHPSTFA